MPSRIASRPFCRPPSIRPRTASRSMGCDAPLNMMSASMQGALAFQKGLGCVHSLSHSLGGIDPRLHHGTLNAIFLPAVIAFNQAAASVLEEHKLDRMAQAMGLGSGAEVGPSVRAMTERLG